MANHVINECSKLVERNIKVGTMEQQLLHTGNYSNDLGSTIYTNGISIYENKKNNTCTLTLSPTIPIHSGRSDLTRFCPK